MSMPEAKPVFTCPKLECTGVSRFSILEKNSFHHDVIIIIIIIVIIIIIIIIIKYVFIIIIIKIY